MRRRSCSAAAHLSWGRVPYTYFYSLRGLAVAVRPLLFGLSEAYYVFMAHTKHDVSHLPLSIFIFFKNVFYINIFLVSQFTVLYHYRPAGGAGRCPLPLHYRAVGTYM